MESQVTRLIDAVKNSGRVSPFVDINLNVSVEVSCVNHGDKTANNSAIQW